MKLFISLSLLLISLTAIAQDSSKQNFKLDRNKIAILKSKNKKNVALNAKEFVVIENILQRCIDSHNSKLDSTSYQFLQLNNYRRQYIAYSDNHQKMVWVNCFCNEDAKMFPYWKKKTVFVYDGGGCFFNVLINLSKQQCEDFWVNGLAYSRSNMGEFRHDSE
jgi:hypothetical protein